MEIWDLKRTDLDFKEKMITFRETKTGVIRSVKMVDEAYELLSKYPKRIDTLQIFPGTKNIHQAFDFRAGFEKALSDAGISDFSFHDLRHTCASYLHKARLLMKSSTQA